MTLSMLSWGVAWPSANIVSGYFDQGSPFDVVFLRFLFGALSIFPVLIYNKESFSFKLSYFKYIVPVSLVFFLYNFSFFTGTQHGLVTKGSVFATTTNPIVTFILMAIIAQKISRFEIFGIFLGFVGGVLIMDIFNTGFSEMFNSRNIYFPACSVLWGVVTIMVSIAQKKVPAIQFIFYCYLLTAIISFPLTDITSNEIIGLDYKFFWHFFIVAIASMAFGTSVYMYSTNILGPIQSSAFIFSVPLIALLSAHFMLDQPVYLTTFIGGTICIMSTFIINKNKENI